MKVVIAAADITSHKDGTTSKDPNAIFLFGSNTKGMHWGGAAGAAHKLFGATWGKAAGPSGHSYAIPTVDVTLDKDEKEKSRRTMTVAEIKVYVDKFVKYVKVNPDKTFFITRIGCAIAGLDNKDIAPLFAPALPNCDYPEEWVKFLDK